MGVKNKSDTCYLIDFGLTKQFRDSQTGEHIKYKDGKSLTGTARYASINTHLGIEQSRRDDLESLGYTILYLYLGSLPWQGLKAKNKTEKYLLICDLKISMVPYKLCEKLPKQFIQYFEYVRSLVFEETPDYLYLKDLLNAIIMNTFSENLDKLDYFK